MFKLQRRPTAPGQILRAHYLEPRNLSVSALAEQADVSRKHLSDIVNGHVRVTPTVAVRLAHALDTSPTLWLNLQAAVDVYEAEHEYQQRQAAAV
jgi:addiction module HigA family antidote